MSGNFGSSGKGPRPSSTLKKKRLRVSDCMSKEEISEDELSHEKLKVKKLVTLSQPTLRSDLKIKLHSLLSNWKPPLKNTSNENNKVCIMKTDNNQESDMKLVKCDDTLSESKQLQNVSPTNPAKFKCDTQDESSFNNDNFNANKNLEQTSLGQHQKKYTAKEPSVTINQQISGASTLEICSIVDFNEQNTNKVLLHDTKASEVIIKDKISDSKSLEDSPNEQVIIPYSKASSGFLTPEVTRTPPTPPTLKISWLQSNGYDLSPSNSKGYTQNEDCEELPNLNRKSSNESNTYNEAELIKDEKENWDQLTLTKKLDLEVERSLANSLNTESEFDVNILQSQRNSIEKNPVASVTQREQAEEFNPSRELVHELNPPRAPAQQLNPSRELVHELNPSRELVHELNPSRELVHELNPPREPAQELNPSRELVHELNPPREPSQDLNPLRELAQEFTHFDFTPFYPTPLAPKMPRINWVHQIQEDKKQLQAVVREISQLNAMMTRAAREIWSARNTH